MSANGGFAFPSTFSVPAGSPVVRDGVRSVQNTNECYVEQGMTLLDAIALECIAPCAAVLAREGNPSRELLAGSVWSMAQAILAARPT